jgi:CRP-like cAMP-binding protein/Ca2+-binding EF-hand superfamily protein
VTAAARPTMSFRGRRSSGKQVANPMYADLDAPLTPSDSSDGARTGTRDSSKMQRMSHESVPTYADEAERALEASLGDPEEYRKPNLMRDLFCRKRGALDHQTCDDIGSVTFLTADEVKDIESVFNLVCKLVHEDGQLHFVTRHSKPPPGTASAEGRHRHMALTTEQLREHLPEFGQNMFLPRLVRLFSETGEQKLSVLELLDLYSAMSRRAHFKWKATVAFCVYDYDEDGVLDEGDIFRTISAMLTGTKTSKRVTKEAAALRIQARARGRAVRRKHDSGMRGNAGVSPGPIDGFAKRILEECSSIRRDIMDYRYFEKQMAITPAFRDNFCVTPTKYTEIYRRYRAYERAKTAFETNSRGCAYWKCWDRCSGLQQPAATGQEGKGAGTQVSNPMHGGADPLALQVFESNKLTKDVSQEIRDALACIVKPHHYFASQIVIKRGSSGHEMYFIAQGTAEVLLDLQQDPIIELTHDDYFGEMAALQHSTKVERNAYVRAKTDLDVFVLHRTDLQVLLVEFPALEQVMHSQMNVKLQMDHLRTEAQLWSRYDESEHGWIQVSDCRKLLRCVLTATGNVRKRGNQSKGKETVEGILNKLITESLPYEVQDDNSVFKPVSQPGVPKQQQKPRSWLDAEAVARICFHEWWIEQPKKVHLYTASRLKLDPIWHSLDHDGDGFLNRDEIRAVLYQMCNYEDDEFDDKAEHWLTKHDTDASGHITIREFTPWFCTQDISVIATAGQVDWRQVSAELRHRDAHHGEGHVSPRHEGGSETIITRMKKMDEELAAIEDRLHFGDALLDDDYDSAINAANILSGKGWQPYGIHGAVRPPMIRVRLRAFRKLAVKGDDKYLRDAAHRKDHWRFMKTIETVGQSENAEFQYLGDVLGDYMDNSPLRHCSWIGDLRIWIKSHIAHAHVGLFSTAIMELEHEFGHGISEVMRIMKWMLLLNFGLAVMWLTLVIVPRDYSDTDATFWNTTGTVLHGLLFTGSQGRSLFYDGYAREPVWLLGVELRMDVLYFIAIVLHVVLSLFAILRTLGIKLTSLAQGGAVGLNVAGGSGQNEFAILGSYDCTVSTSAFAQEMRQGIRHKLEMDLMRREEIKKQEELRKSWTKRLRHVIYYYSGRAASLVLLVGHVYLITQVLKYEQAMGDFLISPLDRLIAPMIISVLNITVPKVLRFIVAHEDHLTTRDILYQYMGRVYIVKMVQLSTILYSMAKIMSVHQIKQDLIDAGLEDNQVSGLLNTYFDQSVSHVAADNGNCDPNDATAGCTCTEARFGTIFFRLVLTDGFVFIGRELFLLYAVNTGLPRFWRWNSIVNHFGRGPEAPTKAAQENGYQLQKRHTEQPRLSLGQSLKDRLAHTKRKPKVTWWKLMPKDDGHLQAFKSQKMQEFVGGLDVRVIREDPSFGFEDLNINDMRAFASCLSDAKLTHVSDIMDSNISPEELTEIVERRRDGRDGRWTKDNDGDKFAELRKLSAHQIRFICEKLVNSEGTWIEVTGTVEELRRYKIHRVEFSNYKSALLMIEMMYRQTFVWVGSTWCPWLPLVACLMQVIMFMVQKHVLLGGAYLRPAQPWSAEQAFKVFMLFALGTLGFTCLPTLIWLNQVPTCGPHGFGGDEDDKAKVFETFGVYLNDLPDDHLLNGEFTVFCAIVLNPPSLLIMLFVLWTRYRYVKTQLKTTQVQVDKVEKAYHTEKKFLTTRLQDLTTKSGGDEQDLKYAQKRYERVMSHLDQQHLDWIIKMMGGKHRMKFLDPDNKGLGASEMQHWVEMAAKIDADNNGVLRGAENLMWHETIEKNTIWLGNLKREVVKESFIRDTLTQLGGGYHANVIACTVRRYDLKEEKELNASNPDKNGLHYRSWALVTFMDAASCDLAQKEYAFSASKARGKATPSTKTKLDHRRDSWTAVKWTEARTDAWSIPGLQGEALNGDAEAAATRSSSAGSFANLSVKNLAGSLGSVRDLAGGSRLSDEEGEGAAAGAGGDEDDVDSEDEAEPRHYLVPKQSPIVREHNRRLHKALERALELKMKVDDVHKEIMGEEGEEDEGDGNTWLPED